MTFYCVPKTEFDQVRPAVNAWLEKGQKHLDGQYTINGIWRDLENNVLQLWIYMENHQVMMVTLTAILEYDTYKACLISFITGKKRQKWLHYLKTIEHWAKQIGCTKMELLGRKSWRRILSDWTTPKIYLEKEI